jgi:integrase
MSASNPSAAFKRHKTRHRGIVYRLREGGKRTYYCYADGRYVAAGGTEKEAVAKQAELRGRAVLGEVVLATRATFLEVAEKWYENNKDGWRRRTRENYRASLDNVLLPRLGRKRIAAVTVDDIAALIRDRKKDGAAPSTISNDLLPLKGAFKLAVRNRLVGTDPSSLLMKNERPGTREKVEAHVWSDAEIAALIECAEHEAEARVPHKPNVDRQNFAPLIYVACFTGLRIGELLGLRWEDVETVNGELRVERQWTRAGEYEPPKTRSSVRRIPLSAEMTKYLAALKLRSKFSGEKHPVFASRKGTPLSHRNVTKRGFAPAAKRAGLRVSIHDTRHAFASRMISRGIDAVTLSELLGHSNPRVTLEVYSHLYDRQKTDDAVRAAMA